MASIQGVIFDMDGLMFDTEPVWGACWTSVCAKVGLEVPDGMVEAVRGRSGETMIATVREYLGPDAPVEWLWEQEKEAVREAIEREGVSKKGGLDELLTYLHDCQIPAAVASSSPKAQIEANLARHGIAGYFDVIVSGESLGKSKPDPAIFLEAALLLGTEPRRTIVLEDALTGVEAGWRGGFITIMVPDLTPPDEKARRRATAIVDRLDDVIDLIEEGRLG